MAKISDIAQDIHNEIKSLREGISFGEKQISRPIDKTQSIGGVSKMLQAQPNNDQNLMMDGDSIIETELETSKGRFEDEINQIRKISLSAIAKLADNPLSDEYNFFKKIWGECDKVITDSVKKTEPQQKSM